jgi:hypothetical protein
MLMTGGKLTGTTAPHLLLHDRFTLACRPLQLVVAADLCFVLMVPSRRDSRRDSYDRRDDAERRRRSSRSRSRSPKRHRRRSPSPRRERQELQPMPDEPEMFGVYRVRAAALRISKLATVGCWWLPVTRHADGG